MSPRQARAAARAEKAQPGAGERLVAKAGSVSVTELENDANRIVAAASSETPEAKAERHRKARQVFHGVDADGMGWGRWRAPIAEHTRLIAQLEAEQQKVFAEARARGDREPMEAYAADTFFRIIDRAARKTPAADAVAPAEDPGEDWSFTKMIVRVDLTALDRGQVAAGEVCEIAGQGPIPVADAWRMIDGDAFVAAVSTKGTEIDKVIHLGRKPTVLQRTALEWFSAGECSTRGLHQSGAGSRSTTSPTGPTRRSPGCPTWPARVVTVTTSRPTGATPSAPASPPGNDGSSHPTAPTHPVTAPSVGPPPVTPTSPASSTPADLGPVSRRRRYRRPGPWPGPP